MNENKDVSKIISIASERGLIVQPQSKGYLLKIPLFKEVRGTISTTGEDVRLGKQPLSYLPYCVNSISEIKTVADRLWRNENYKRMVQKAQANARRKKSNPNQKRQG